MVYRGKPQISRRSATITEFQIPDLVCSVILSTCNFSLIRLFIRWLTNLLGKRTLRANLEEDEGAEKNYRDYTFIYIM